MKRLISAKSVLDAAKEHKDLTVDKNTIVTAQAADLARENGVLLVFDSDAQESSSKGSAATKAPEAHEGATASCGATKEQEPVLTASQIEEIMTAAVDKGLWTADELQSLLHGNAPATQELPPVTVGVSNRHIHLSQEHLEQLFGKGHELTPIKDLSQPGQFASKECVTLVGPRGVIEKVRVLGPVRARTQVEVLAADTFKLGVPQAIRLSGHLEGTPGITVVGPEGTVVLPEGVIVAARHIHMTPEDAARRGLHDGQVVSIKFGGERGGQLDEVVIRATRTGALDCHIDTEEANALHIKNGSVVEVVK